MLPSLRSAADDDVPAIVAWLVDDPLMRRYGHTAASLRRMLDGAVADPDGFVVAEAGGPVGFAWFLARGALGASAYLRLIAVAPAHRGGGTGGLLLDEVERRAAAGSRHLLLLVSDFNAGAQRFYERRGYARAGVLPAFVVPDVDEWLYMKKLPPAAV